MNCLNCGDCCSSFVAISKEEKAAILNYVKQKNIKLNSNSLNCIFLNKTKHCNIYEVRPQICKKFTCKVTRENLPKLDYFIKECFINEIFG